MARIKHALPDLKEARNRRKEETKRIAYELCKEYENIGVGKTYHIFTYGCQGNEADSEVMSGILEQMGFTYNSEAYESDIVILNTCAIRENAENRICSGIKQILCNWDYLESSVFYHRKPHIEN